MPLILIFARGSKACLLGASYALLATTDLSLLPGGQGRFRGQLRRPAYEGGAVWAASGRD